MTEDQLKKMEGELKAKEKELNARDKILDGIIDFVFIGASFLTISVGSFLAESLSSKGLALDMAGFLIIFGFGLPSRFATAWDRSPKTPMAQTLSAAGVLLVSAGFVLQFLGSLKP
jgi:hypothetical protein